MLPMNSPSPLPPPPAFKQRRAARTYDSLLEAARPGVRRQGASRGRRRPDIAAAAGVSTGALYRYFKDKRHLFIEMLRHHLAHARAEVAPPASIRRASQAQTRASPWTR